MFNIVAKTAEIINTFRSDVDELAIAEERLAQTQKMIADGKFPMGVEAANHQLREQALTVIELRKAQEEQKKTQEELNEVNNAAIDRIRGLNGQCICRNHYGR